MHCNVGRANIVRHKNVYFIVKTQNVRKVNGFMLNRNVKT